MGTLLVRLKNSYRIICNEFRKPNAIVYKEAFEDYLRRNIFLNSYYDFLYGPKSYQAGLEYSHSVDIFSGGVIPDFVVKDKISGGVFAIEAKFRKTSKNDTLTLCSEKRLTAYRIFAEHHAVDMFVALGVNGTVEMPRRVFVVPLQKIQSAHLSLMQLVDYEVERKALCHPNYLSYLARQESLIH